MSSAYLFNEDKNPTSSGERFFTKISESFKWALGDIIRVLEMPAESAFKIQRQYNERSLTSTYGMVYGATQALAITEMGYISILVDRRERDGEITVEEIDPVNLMRNASAFVPCDHAAVDNPNVSEEAVYEKGKCIKCGRAKILSFEDDRNYMPKPKSWAN